MKSAGSYNGGNWAYLEVLVARSPDFDCDRSIDAILELSRGDQVLIDQAAGRLPIVRDPTGNALGMITRAAQRHFRQKVGAPLPGTAVFDRVLVFGCLLRVAATAVTSLPSSFCASDLVDAGAAQAPGALKRVDRI